MLVVKNYPDKMKPLTLFSASLLSLSLSALCCGAAAQEWSPSRWPVLKHYDADHLYRIALPLGGIGTGTVSLGGRGELRDWEIMNTPAKGFSPAGRNNDSPFFAIWVGCADGTSTTTMLAGEPYTCEYLDEEGRPIDHAGLPRFGNASFDAAYPFGQVNLSDASLPVRVTVKGFNPLVAADASCSSLPVAVLSYSVENVTDSPIEVSVCGSIRNFIGRDGATSNTIRGNRNSYRDTGSLRGIFYSAGEQLDTLDPAWGTMALTTAHSSGVTWRTTSVPNWWSISMLNFWDDFGQDGLLTPLEGSNDDDPMGSLAIKQTVAPHSTADFTFFLTWHFPNRKAWSKQIEGNYYTTLDADAWQAAERIVPLMPQLERRTLAFVESFLASTLPDVVKEAALFNLSTLRSQTVFRLPDGHLMGWEGVRDRRGSCEGSCTHVWNYEVATPFLFGELARSMRDVEFNYALRDNGFMSFRAALPLSRATEGTSQAAADGQMGCVVKFYREWQLSGDTEWLVANWPNVRKALAFAWVEGGWDADRDGVEEGCQHNTMDVEYYGPNPQMEFWYMAALRAGEQMAQAVGDKQFAKECRRIFESASSWVDSNLFNGSYYEHHITDPDSHRFIDLSDPNVEVPYFQLGRGCLVDQLVGQYMAHICNLGYLADPTNIATTCQSIMHYNFVDNFSRHFNNMRSYVMTDEQGLLMASWPNGRLRYPFPYFSEVMTGFEYAAAVEMIYEGMTDEALRCIKAIRDRHDGAKRNPFSEPECGHHYARAMASWGAVIAMSDFHFSAVDRSMNFTRNNGTYFWSNGYAWGLCKVGDGQLRLEVKEGSVDLKSLTLSGSTKPVARNIRLGAGESVEVAFD